MIDLELILSTFWALAAASALALITSTVLGFFGRLWWVFDLFSHFRVQYFFGLLVSTLLFLAGDRLVWAAASGLFTALNLVLILPLYISQNPNRPASQNQTYRVLMANVLKKNKAYNKIAGLIRQYSPDLIVLVEVNQTWMDALKDALHDYPYTEQPLREDNYGVALLSRYPFTSSEVRSFCDARVPSIITQVALDGHALTLVGTHPPPPKSSTEARQRNQQLNQIAEYVGSLDSESIVLGDLNISPWSPFMLSMLAKSGLRDSRHGFGVQASWPTDRLPLLVPIDHVLVSDGIFVSKRVVGPPVGSDHFPVIVDFSFSKKQEGTNQ